MPFIKQERRDRIDDILSGVFHRIEPGDRCYGFYKRMVDAWRTNPKWTTAHELFRDMIISSEYELEDLTAVELAWQVFFQLYVMPYEISKRNQNGDV